MDSLEKMLRAAEDENTRLRLRIVELQTIVEKLQKIIAEDMTARMNSNRDAIAIRQEDDALFAMMKDHSPCPDGVRQVIR